MGGPYRGKLLELGETILAHLPEVGKVSGNPAPKLADRWKSGVWLGKSDLTDEHLVQTDDGVVSARSVRRLAENSWSGNNLKAVIETPQKPRSMTTDAAAERHQKYMNMRIRTKKRTRTMMRTEKHTTSHTVRIMTWRERRFQSPTQLRRRARAEERSAQKHNKMCL